MIFRLTEATRKKVKIPILKSSNTKPETQFFDEWYVNSFQISRKPYLIFTEAKTMFSIVKYAKGIIDQASLEKLANESFVEIVIGLAPDLKIQPYTFGKAEYWKTENNAIRKNQSDMIYHAKRYAEDHVNVFEINRIPLKAIGFRFAEDAFIEQMAVLLRKYGAIWLPNDLSH